jgi:hypothetical protein
VRRLAVVIVRSGHEIDHAPPAPGVLVRLLAAVMLGIGPAALALEASGALSRLQVHGPPAAVLLLYRAAVAGLGMVVAPSLWAGRAGAVSGARWWLALDAVGTVLTYATPFFPSNRPPGAKRLALAVALALNAAWFAYLRGSHRVRSVWPEARGTLL